MSSLQHRMDLLCPMLARYERRFSVLDIGGGVEPEQNVGQQIAREYNACVTVIEKDWTPEKFQFSPRTMVLKREVTVEDLRLLRECEHFDVVLGLNVLHWFPTNWKDAADTVMSLGDWAVLQIPKIHDYTAVNHDIIQDLHSFINSRRPEWLGDTVQFPKHMPRPLLLAKGPQSGKRTLTRTNVEAHAGSAETHIHSDSTMLRRYMKGESKSWIPGINLWNFCQMGGVYPSRERIAQLLRAFKLPDTNHGDVTPHNFVFDGEVVHLIDGFEGWGGDDKLNMEETIRRVVA